MTQYTNDYLLNLKVKIFQPVDGYRASTDAVLLASLIPALKPGNNILDVGSGTGAVSLCLAHRFRKQEPVICGLELQPELAELSNLSAAANGFEKFLTYCHADIRHKQLPLSPGSFSHVISNPPYALADMPSPNPSKSLAHNLQDLDLGGWIKFCLKMLKPFGYFYMVNRAEAITEILSALHHKAGGITLIPVYSKTGQEAKRILVCAQKDSKAPTVIRSGLTVHLDNGEYSPQAQQILREGKSFFEIF